MGVGISDKLNDAIDEAFNTVQRFNENTKPLINQESEMEFYSLIQEIFKKIKNNKRKDFTLSYGAYNEANVYIFRAMIYNWENHEQSALYNSDPMEALRNLKKTII